MSLPVIETEPTLDQMLAAFDPKKHGGEAMAGYTQTADLAQEIGSQSVVSEILNGHRQINARQAKALAQRFGVSSSVFI